MTLIASIDGTSSPRLIYLHVDTVGATVHPIDIYKEMRTLRLNDEGLRKFDLFMSASGNVPKGGGKFTERYVTLLNTRLVPYNTPHILTINGTIITDDGFEGILTFDKNPLDVGTSVDINYIPPQVEIIEVNTGSGVTAQDIIDISEESASQVRIELAIEMASILRTETVVDNIQVDTTEINTKMDSSLIALSSVLDIITLLQKYEENRTLIDKTANTLTVFDDDNVTPLLQFSLLDSTGTPSTLEVAERVPI